VSSSGAGSPGNETDYFGPATKAAIQKFQVKYGIANPGDAGYGSFGPKTRAKMSEVAKTKGL
ncbi:MAG: peptidoglycan-binding protein, partial [Candidatus Zambryskibacteria bacterium]|nr:peptidoglycan-binding protein [Candidatus Zambryskibacteria bacterium]